MLPFSANRDFFYLESRFASVGCGGFMGLKPFSYFANLAIEVMSNRCPGTELIMAANLISMYSKKTKLPLMTRQFFWVKGQRPGK